MAGILNVLLGAGGLAGVASLPDPINGTRDSSVTLALENDGDINVTSDGVIGQWVDPANTATASQFEARASNLTGNTGNASGTFDTWLDLSSTRSWGVSGGNNNFIEFDLEIRDKANQIVRASAEVTLTALEPA